jgi:hypothetical protein
MLSDVVEFFDVVNSDESNESSFNVTVTSLRRSPRKNKGVPPHRLGY